ncbi:MAG TPA: 2-dehydropantoate 2-reductase [Natronosporangium sp.]
MTICVYGAGSIGCYVGGRLAATGSQVVFVGRERLAREIAQHGLTLTDWRGTELRVPAPRYETTPDPVVEADLVLVTVKSADTGTVAERLAGRLKPGAVVVSFQNGLRNPELLRDRLPGAPVLPGVVGFNVVHHGAGRFHCATGGALEVQQHAGLSEAAAAFERAGLPLVQRADMAGSQAAKLLLNLNNAVNALSGRPLKEELSQRAYRRCLALAQREALAAYAAAGITPVKLTPLPPRRMPALLSLPDAVFTRVASRMLAIDPLARSSMWEDLEAGRATEVDYLNGEIVALARKHGRQAPVNQRLVDLVHQAERGGRRDWSGDELLAELTAGIRHRG